MPESKRVACTISMTQLFKRHETVKHGDGEYARDGIHTNGMESVGAVLKRAVHECAFRLNDGNCEVGTVDRMDALARRVGGKHTPHAELAA